jgi:hypothetical protein
MGSKVQAPYVVSPLRSLPLPVTNKQDMNVSVRLGHRRGLVRLLKFVLVTFICDLDWVSLVGILCDVVNQNHKR